MLGKLGDGAGRRSNGAMSAKQRRAHGRSRDRLSHSGMADESPFQVRAGCRPPPFDFDAALGVAIQSDDRHVCGGDIASSVTNTVLGG